MARILVVEDEPHMRMGLKDNLAFESYEIEIAEDGKTAMSLLQKQAFDLILLDVMLPEISGFDVCKQARKMNLATPIIFLTAKGEEIDRVFGLEIGADDYIVKPFSLKELLARVKAVLRRTANEGVDKPDAIIGNLTFDFTHYEAFHNDIQVKLSHKEFEIVQHLWQNRNLVVSRTQLLKEVWGYESQPTTRTVDNFILKLRQKIEVNPNEPKHILTVHGIGYKLIV